MSEPQRPVLYCLACKGTIPPLIAQAFLDFYTSGDLEGVYLSTLIGRVPYTQQIPTEQVVRSMTIQERAGKAMLTPQGAVYCSECAPLEQLCHRCGCTNAAACPGGCSWVAPDLCSQCEEKAAPTSEQEAGQ